MTEWLKAAWLFAQIVWRYDTTNMRMSAYTAWSVARTLHPGAAER